MAVRIGHASIDENNGSKGGTAGDQTGKEVCTRSWYNGGWTFLARPRDTEAAEKIAAACEAGCANNLIGYDQNQRNSLDRQAKKVDYDLSRVDQNCETDCSAFVTVCIRAAGVEIPDTNGNAPTTASLKAVLCDTGAFDILTAGRYLSHSAWLRRGDILVKPGKHTVMVLDDGPFAKEANVSMPLLTKGSCGVTVRVLQTLLGAVGCECGSSGADGCFGSATESAVKTFQKSRGLTCDGEVGEKTWTKLLGIG